MSASLWSRRSRPPFGSSQWCKSWGKRLLTLDTLLSVQWRISGLRRRGAAIGCRVFISPANVQGDLKRLSIGDGTFIGRVQIQVVADVRIGKAVCMNDGVRLLSASHSTSNPAWPMISRPIVVEDHAWVATGAMILPGVTVGQGAVVGAGAVVRSDVPPFAIVTGNPAQDTGTRRPSELRYEPVNSVALFNAWLS